VCCKSTNYCKINPFISIHTPSKPLISSGSWLTLHNCEIFYLLAVNNDPATADLNFIRVNIYPGPGEGGSLLIFYPFILSGSLFTLRPYPTILEEVTIYPGGGGRGLTGLQGSYLSSLYSKPDTLSPVWIWHLPTGEVFLGAKKKTIVALLVFNPLWATLNLKLSPNFLTLKEPRNRFKGINSASLCSLAVRYDNPIHTRFLAPIDCLKIQHRRPRPYFTVVFPLNTQFGRL
jgi:hypothetical protein